MISDWFYLCAFLCGDLLKREKGKMSLRDKLLFLQIIACMGRHLTLHYQQERQKLLDRIDDEQPRIEDKEIDVSPDTINKIIELLEACRDFKTVRLVSP
jgi:hypothetical protein